MGTDHQPLPAVRFTVTPEQIAAFADAIGDPSPVYRDVEAARAAGYEAQIAPPTFSMRIQIEFAHLIAASEEIGWEGVLHGDQEFEQIAPIVAGRTYDGQAFEVGMRGRPPTRFLAIETDVTDVETGEVVQRSRTTLICRDET
jgi:acyl dehydratase